MNMLIVIQVLADPDRFGVLKQVCEAAQCIGQMAVVQEFAGFALAQQHKPGVLSGHCGVEKFTQKYAA